MKLVVGRWLSVGDLPHPSRIPADGFRWRLAWGPVTHTVEVRGEWAWLGFERFAIYLARRHGRTFTLWRGEIVNMRALHFCTIHTPNGDDWEPLEDWPTREDWL